MLLSTMHGSRAAAHDGGAEQPAGNVPDAAGGMRLGAAQRHVQVQRGGRRVAAVAAGTGAGAGAASSIAWAESCNAAARHAAAASGRLTPPRDACRPASPATRHQAAPPDGVWSWRTPLAASQPYWQGWYSGLSDAFLALTVPKMLLLAGTDRCVCRCSERACAHHNACCMWRRNTPSTAGAARRRLDKVLTIGQMQGKFQLVLMPAAGHAIQVCPRSRTLARPAQLRW